MATYDYAITLSRAKTCKNHVEKSYDIGINPGWSYYFAKQILKPKVSVNRIKIDSSVNPAGDYISRQIYKNEYIAMAEKFVKYVEKMKRLPSHIIINLGGKDYKVKKKEYVYMFARILIFYDQNKKYPSYANVTSKAFTKPTETGNTVYDYACKKFGRTFKTLDDILEYVQNNFTYEFYYDDYKSNKQVTDSKAGNCTDLLQWLANMVKPLGYEFKCIHVQCRSSGTGHVFGQFRHATNTGGKWITRDIASVASGNSITSVWCEDGYVQATNPSWFTDNLNR